MSEFTLTNVDIIVQNYTIMSSLIRRLIFKLLVTFFDKPLPALSAREIAMIDELRETFCGLQPVENRVASASQKIWNDNANLLCELMLREDPREFLRWDVIRKTMFVSNQLYIKRELNYLLHLSEWEKRWREALVEVSTGHPLPYPLYPKSSGNLIHQAYHLAQFEEKTRICIHVLNFVFEFGGGYGSMCRLFHNLGFRGKYVIFDLPAFSALQRFYLKSLNIPLLSTTSFWEGNRGVLCISDYGELKTLFSCKPLGKNLSMFVATWSLSEAPIDLRMAITSLIVEYGAFLIAYADAFGEVNNIEFFNKWQEFFGNRVEWHSWEINHIPRNFYLVGKRLQV